MPHTQMNVRIDEALKRQGDAVLKKHGYSPSTAIRSLYAEVVSKNDVPTFMKKAQIADAPVSETIEEGCGLAWKALGIEPPANFEVDIETAKEEHALKEASAYGL